jgi:hypothetical protein
MQLLAIVVDRVDLFMAEVEDVVMLHVVSLHAPTVGGLAMLRPSARINLKGLIWPTKLL